MKFEFIVKHRGAWRTRDLCEALGVSRGGFYEGLRRPASHRSRENLQLMALVRASFEQNDGTLAVRASGATCAPGVSVVAVIGSHV